MRTALLATGLFECGIACAQPKIMQISNGWCSPNISNVVEAVVICRGVDPKALDRLNRELKKMKVSRENALQQAEKWAAKYHELEVQIESLGDQEPRRRRAIALLQQGDLEGAESILRAIKVRLAPATRTYAATSFALAGLAELRFDIPTAMKEYEDAWHKEADRVEYALAYGAFLLDHNKSEDARFVYRKTAELLTARLEEHRDTTAADLANVYIHEGQLFLHLKDPANAEKYLTDGLKLAEEAAARTQNHDSPLVASALNLLGSLWESTGRQQQAEAAYIRGIEAASGDLEMLIALVNNIGGLARDLHRYGDAEFAFSHLLSFYEDREQKGKKVPDDGKAITLVNRGGVRAESGNFQGAESDLLAALPMLRELAQKDSGRYSDPFGAALINLSYLYLLPKHENFEKGKDYLEQAARLFKPLADQEPMLYSSELIMTLNQLGCLFRDVQRYAESLRYLDQARTICEKLAQSNPMMFDSLLAIVTNNLGLLHRRMQDFDDAEKIYKVSRALRVKLAEENFEANGPMLAKLLTNLSALYLAWERPVELVAALRDEESVLVQLVKDDPSYRERLEQVRKELAVLGRP